MIKEIKDTVNKILPTYASGFVRPRGLAIPIDPWIRGELRWGQKLGGNGSIWVPDIQLKLTEEVRAGEYTLYVEEKASDSPGDLKKFMAAVDGHLSEMNPEWKTKRDSHRLSFPHIKRLPVDSYQRLRDYLCSHNMSREGQYKVIYLRKGPVFVKLFRELAEKA